MNYLINEFVRQGGALSFTNEDKLLWLTYRLLTPDELDMLKFLGFGISVKKSLEFSHTEEVETIRKVFWLFKKVDKTTITRYKDVVRVSLFPVSPKPTLEVL